MGFRTPIVLARVRFLWCFLFFSFCFFSAIFSSCYSVGKPFSESNHIRQTFWWCETTLYLRLERPYYTPYYITAFLHEYFAYLAPQSIRVIKVPELT